jgi:hypothetical protein
MWGIFEQLDAVADDAISGLLLDHRLDTATLATERPKLGGIADGQRLRG